MSVIYKLAANEAQLANAFCFWLISNTRRHYSSCASTWKTSNSLFNELV